MFWRNRDRRNGWLMYFLLLTAVFVILPVLFTDTWTFISQMSTPQIRFKTHEDQSSTTMTAPSGSKRNITQSFLWLPKQDPVDVRRFPLLSQHSYSQEAKDGMTVVFPVSEASLGDLHSNIDSIISAHSVFFYEIIIACDPRIATRIKQAISSLIAHEIFFVAIPVTVLPWSHSDTPSSGVLHILNSVLTSRVLLLDITALRFVDDSVRTMLLDSLPIDVPIGPHGILVTPYNMSCIYSLEHTVPAAYLIPPILAPTKLLIDAENGATSVTNTWAAIGDRIAKIKRAGFGGLVLKNSRQAYRWCTKSLTSFDSIFASTFLQPFYKLLEMGVDRQRFASTRLNALLPGRDELISISPTLCEMAHRGYTLHIMLLSWTEDTSSHFALDMGCHLHFEDVPSDTSTGSLTQRLKAWTFADDFDVLVYTSERLIQTMVIEAAVERFRLSGGSIVRIPTADLAFCEWMAMLSISDWHRMYYLLLCFRHFYFELYFRLAHAED